MVYVSPFNSDEGDLETGTRVCRICGERKPMNQFNRTTGGYRERKCKTCRAAQAVDKGWNSDKIAKAKSRLKRVYGLTPEDVEKMLKSQEGSCAICTIEITDENKAIDHCHDSGHVRALLCRSCNTGLGYFKDSPEFLRSAADYLDEHSNRVSNLEPRKKKPKGNPMKGRPKLTMEAATEIRALSGSGSTVTDLAQSFGVTGSTISRILKNESWVHNPLEPSELS